MTAQEALLTVILPTKNEENNVPGFLASLPPEIPLIVLDDSEDNTREVIRALRPYNTHIVNIAGGVAAKRHYGAQMAETEWLMFTDADIQFAPDYFEEVCDNLKGDLVYGPKSTAGGHEFYYGLFSLGQKVASFFGIPAASASNMIVRRKAFIDVGGFDVNLPCNEDTDLAFRLVRAGYKSYWAPSLIVRNTDHRRLHRGIMWRYAHGLVRSLLVFLSLKWQFPRQWLYSDWGYWNR